MAKKTSGWKSKLNLQILAGTKIEPIDGDFFVLKPKTRGYLFGRVIQAHVKMLSWDGVLVYIYKPESADKQLPATLSREHLLIAPLIIEAACWGSGFLEKIGASRLVSGDVLKQHCFSDDEGYVDQNGKALARKSSPCGDYGLTTVQGLDNEVSQAIGLPLVRS